MGVKLHFTGIIHYSKLTENTQWQNPISGKKLMGAARSGIREKKDFLTDTVGCVYPMNHRRKRTAVKDLPLRGSMPGGSCSDTEEKYAGDYLSG